MTRKPSISSAPTTDEQSASPLPETALDACLPSVPDHASKATRSGSKLASVIALMERPEGASLDDIIAATGWLPHSARASLTGLRKKGMVLAKSRENERTVYRVVETASEATPDAIEAA